jgi:hypothetical protein
MSSVPLTRTRTGGRFVMIVYGRSRLFERDREIARRGLFARWRRRLLILGTVLAPLARCAGALVLAAAAGLVTTGPALGASADLRAAVASAAGSKPAPIVMPAGGRTLGGLTSQGNAIVLRISKKDQRIDAVNAGLAMSCTSGDQFLMADWWARLPISKNGSVRVSVTIPASAGSGGSGSTTGSGSGSSGTTYTFAGGTDTFSGKLDPKHATFAGVWDLHLTYALSTGQTDRCDSGRVRFKAVL